MDWFLDNNGNGRKWVNSKKVVFVSYITHSTAILFLPYLLREIPDDIFEKPEHNQLRIVVSGVDLTSYDMVIEERCVFRVRVGNVTMCRCIDFVCAFAVMIVLHYIFNVTYTKKIEATMICVQRLLLEIRNNQKMPPNMLSLTCRIKKDMGKYQTLIFENKTLIRTSSVSIIKLFI